MDLLGAQHLIDFSAWESVWSLAQLCRLRSNLYNWPAYCIGGAGSMLVMWLEEGLLGSVRKLLSGLSIPLAVAFWMKSFSMGLLVCLLKPAHKNQQIPWADDPVGAHCWPQLSCQAVHAQPIIPCATLCAGFCKLPVAGLLCDCLHADCIVITT